MTTSTRQPDAWYGAPARLPVEARADPQRR